jgi:tripartite-type tricarboxylate transporter receptor subunit TctC
MGQWLSERLGQSIVIENRPGAGGNIAAEAAVHAVPDGYTLLLAGTPNAINATLYDNLSFVFLRDIAPVAAFVRVPNVMVVNPSVPAKSVPEFIAYAKSNPGKINMGSAGNGSSPHAAGELFKMMAGVNLVHIPYRGAAPALTDLIGGQVQVIFETMPPAIGYIRAGRLRALAVTTATRSEALPDVPTVASFVPGYEASASYGIGAPKDTPAEIIRRLNTQVNAGLADPTMKARFAELGGAGASSCARGVRKTHRRRDREVGQGDEILRRRAGLTRGSSGPLFASKTFSILGPWRRGRPGFDDL